MAKKKQHDNAPTEQGVDTDLPLEETADNNCLSQEEYDNALSDAAKYLDIAQRTAAEFENYKKRNVTLRAEIGRAHV